MFNKKLIDTMVQSNCVFLLGLAIHHVNSGLDSIFINEAMLSKFLMPKCIHSAEVNDNVC